MRNEPFGVTLLGVRVYAASASTFIRRHLSYVRGLSDQGIPLAEHCPSGNRCYAEKTQSCAEWSLEPEGSDRQSNSRLLCVLPPALDRQTTWVAHQEILTGVEAGEGQEVCSRKELEALCEGVW